MLDIFFNLFVVYLIIGIVLTLGVFAIVFATDPKEVKKFFKELEKYRWYDAAFSWVYLFLTWPTVIFAGREK